MEKLFTVREVADLTQLHEVTIRRYIRDGKLAAVRIGRRVRVPREEVDKLMSPEKNVDVIPEAPAVLREPAVIYETSSTQGAVDASQAAILARMTADLETLKKPNLLKVLELVADLKAEQEKLERKALAQQMTKQAFLSASRLADVPREELWQQFNELIEEVRRQAIQEGTAIDGDWIDD